MGSLAARITELEAVNRMLISIGETPVHSLSSGITEAAVAHAVLLSISKEVQQQGWACNTEYKVKLTKNNKGEFPVAQDIIKIDCRDPLVKTTVKKSPNGDYFILWKNDGTYQFTQNELEVDIVRFLNFDELTPALQTYIMYKAGHHFQKGMISSTVLYQFTAEDVATARQCAEAEEAEVEETNALRTSPSCYTVSWRINDIYGY